MFLKSTNTVGVILNKFLKEFESFDYVNLEVDIKVNSAR